MSSYYGPFDAFWAGDVPRHLHLMNLHASEDDEPSFSDKAISILKKIISENDAALVRQETEKMLSDMNWRANLVGAVCLFILDKKEHPSLLGLIWERLDEGSWVAPQLAVTVALLDTGFKTRSTSLLQKKIENPGRLPDEKGMGSLERMLDLKYGNPGIMLPAEKIGEITMGKKIAEKWMKGVRHYFPQYQDPAGS